MTELLTTFGAVALVRVAWTWRAPQGVVAIGVAAAVALMMAQVSVNPSLVAAGAVWCAAALCRVGGATGRDRGFAAPLGAVGVGTLLASTVVPWAPPRVEVYAAMAVLGLTRWLRARIAHHAGVSHPAVELLGGVTISLLCMVLHGRAGLGWAEALTIVVGGALGWLTVWPNFATAPSEPKPA